MKFRKYGVKREHSIIKDLRSVLESIAKWEEVQGVIPGRINPARHRGKMKITISYLTESGLKAIARNAGAVQEVFFISSDPKSLESKLRSTGIVN